MSRQPPVQQPPPVLKLELRYAKVGRARFASHRDFGRAFERALRRAEVPMAYSSGFSPHPRISYAGAAPTGTASDAEYLEIGLAEIRDATQLVVDLNRQLPDGFKIQSIREATSTKLADQLQASTWLLSGDHGVLDIASFLAADEVIVTRQTRKGVREFNVRPAVVRLSALSETELELVLRHTEPLVRPDDVIKALVADVALPPFILCHRTHQGLLVRDQVENLF